MTEEETTEIDDAKAHPHILDYMSFVARHIVAETVADLQILDAAIDRTDLPIEVKDALQAHVRLCVLLSGQVRAWIKREGSHD